MQYRIGDLVILNTITSMTIPQVISDSYRSGPLLIYGMSEDRYYYVRISDNHRDSVAVNSLIGTNLVLLERTGLTSLETIKNKYPEYFV